jgi:hypothetical protein
MEVSTGHNLDSNTKHGVFVFPRGKTMVSVSSTAILIVIGKLGNNNNNDQTSGFASDQTWCDHPRGDEYPTGSKVGKFCGWNMLELGRKGHRQLCSARRF